MSNSQVYDKEYWWSFFIKVIMNADYKILKTLREMRNYKPKAATFQVCTIEKSLKWWCTWNKSKFYKNKIFWRIKLSILLFLKNCLVKNKKKKKSLHNVNFHNLKLTKYFKSFSDFSSIKLTLYRSCICSWFVYKKKKIWLLFLLHVTILAKLSLSYTVTLIPRIELPSLELVKKKNGERDEHCSHKNRHLY